MNQTAIPCMQLRGGSSKGVYFFDTDLPGDTVLRDEVLKWVMGAHGDPRQIDGLGGADPLTSKIAIVGKPTRPDCDLDYLFIQALVGEDALDATPNCGNLLAGVGAFALEGGLIERKGDTAGVAVHMLNSGNRCDLSFPIRGGLPVYEGTAQIDGVAGTAAAVLCQYHDLAGALCGALLPTGQACNEYEGVRVTCVDNGMPVVCLRAEDFGISGNESPDDLNANTELKRRLESIRLAAGADMNLGDVEEKAVPKMCLTSPAAAGGSMNTRTFIPKSCHKAIGVLGAVSAATAALLPGGAIHDLATIPAGDRKEMRIEHPSGHFDVVLELAPGGSGDAINVLSAGLLRTTRLLSRGEVYVPQSVWQGRESRGGRAA